MLDTLFSVVDEICSYIPSATVKSDHAVRTFVIAIDGRCAAGKTTLAHALALRLDCPCIHTDDFFLRREQRTAERYEEVGGNIDRERFFEEVVCNIGKEFIYRPFSCKTMDMGDRIFVPCSDVLIIEGAYSLHPYFQNYYDLSVFADADPDEQRFRIDTRNGKVALKNFLDRWIPFEEKYISEFSIIDKCDIRVHLREETQYVK